MFYLKYRPKTFSQLDSAKVRNSLTSLLQSQELPHAFLFTGQKGTGKTSTARILAKAVNCHSNRFADKSEDVEPCNTCASCMAIEKGSSPDVVEMDAASNRGIDEVRTLIRDSAFAPMSARYKVYIIDEAHMITNDAFNALLKTLEEPPPSTLFVLATTNEEKIPRTIISRCFRVFFGKAQKKDIVSMLQRVASQENASIEEGVFPLVASYADHSFRDAAKILEDLIIQKKLTVTEAQNHLGLHGKQTLLQVMQEQPLKEALAWIHDYSESGGEIKQVLESSLQTLQEQLLVQNGVIEDEGESLSLSTAEIGKCMKLFTEAYGMLRMSPIDAVPLEIAVVEFYNSTRK